MLRFGAGLDNGKRTRLDYTDAWSYIFRELDDKPSPPSRPFVPGHRAEDDEQQGLIFQNPYLLEGSLHLPATVPYHTSTSGSDPCDPNYPRIYHMFWAGPFTDKPYAALLSFLYTQNLGLHHPRGATADLVCRPKFWMWINPGPAASKPNPNAVKDMFDTLAANPWSSPFLHSRFKDVIEFKLWNTTDQLDGIPEIKDKWRSVASLFNSGGYKYKVKNEKESTAQKKDSEEQNENVTSTGADPSPTSISNQGAKDMYNMVGSSSASDYDRLSVILSDMARFILCHRFGGTYLDADTILLRDWEELWGWKGAFAYRWSRLERYNTAVLRMNKGSALGSFLFYTALRNDLDFHPMTVSRYMKDAYLEGLLLRLPDALFDPAWLNTEDYQRDRPPFPYFTE
jgi:WD repeat and SOF domain-containing protein 1